MHIKIGLITGDFSANELETIHFAATELKKYLAKVLDYNISIYTLQEKREDCLCITMADEIFELDDSITIKTEGFCGVISGSNARSCLMGVYRYLAEHGFVFLRPAFDIIPENFKVKNIDISETASYRHRGFCIEGSVFYESIEDLIDWLPKVYMNEYYIQFEAPSYFFNRWYDGKERNLNTLDDDEVVAMVKTLECEITKRGLIYQTIGHGWTCLPFNIPATGWTEIDVSKYNHAVPYLAQVDGKRQFMNNKPLNTNLCYSNPVVIEKMTDSITEYCRSNPHVDYVHVWLADGKNNNCECENCVKKRPSDFYVHILNEVDKKLTDEGINTKLVFLIYVDLLWAPEYETLNNPDRFALMFAPITRTYTTSFKADEPGTVAPYERNKLVMPRNVSDNIAHLRSWQKKFKTDSFDFDYHFMWDHFKDIGYYKIAQILMEDIKGLADIGLNGFLSCQNQRTFLPTALPMQCMAAALWNKDVTFDDVKDHVLTAEFGDGAILAEGFLKSLSEYLQPEILRCEKPIETDEAVKGYTKLNKLVEDFAYTVEKQLVSSEGAPRVAWENLKIFLEILTPLAKFYLEFSKGNHNMLLLEKAIDTAYNYRVRLRDVFDVQQFEETLRNIEVFKKN